MISNIYLFIVYYLIISLSIIGYGLIFFSLNHKFKISSNYGYAGLVGVIILCIYSYITSFFYEHNENHNIIIILIGFVFFIYSSLNNNKQKFNVLFFCLIIYFIGILIFKTHDDFKYYHFQYSYYLTQMPSAIGVGNFNLGFRTPSSIFYLNSLFFLPFMKYFMFHMSAFTIFLYCNLILISKFTKFKSKKEFNYITAYFLFTFIFINIFFYRLSEHGTDRTAQILALILIGEILVFINLNKIIEKNFSKLVLIIALIISLKAFYILYILFFVSILFKLINSKGLSSSIVFVFSNIYSYLLLFLLTLILLVNFYNTGCLIYPVSITCFENNIWSIPKAEVVELNNWYELWSKAGANPSFRVDNPEIYIQKFNWISNWFDEYFFTKVSDFLIGIIFLSVVVYLTLSPYVKTNIYLYIKRHLFTLFVLLILLLEWFYNHPSLRYGGYCLIASFFFLLISFKIQNTKYKIKELKKKISILVLITFTIFILRNVDRILDENEQYGYNPLKNVFYNIDEQHFEIDKRMNKIIYDYKNCKNENCNDLNNIGLKKVLNTYIFYKKK